MQELDCRQRLKDDYAAYAADCLKIRAKAGKIAPLRFNRAQAYIHDKLEEQSARTGNLSFEAEHESDHDDLVIALALAVWWPHSKGVPRCVDHDTGELKERA